MGSEVGFLIDIDVNIRSYHLHRRLLFPGPLHLPRYGAQNSESFSYFKLINALSFFLQILANFHFKRRGEISILKMFNLTL